MVYLTQPGQSISKTLLRDFCINQDNVFRPEFLSHVVFYRYKEDNLIVYPEMVDKLKAWDTQSWVFMADKSGAQVPPGPYVLMKGRTWQPWQIYYDFCSTFMSKFKPLLGSAGK